MRVPDLNLTGASASESQRTSQTGETSGSGVRGSVSSKGEQSGDRVEFSASLGSLTRAVSSYQSDRAGRVQQLAAQYRSGQYQPDALATSQGMVAEALSAGGQ